MPRFMTLTTLLLAAAALPASDGPLLLRQPALSAKHIVFAHAGDLWITAREGGEARRLTTGIGLESQPHFSPDGRTIAFTGEYDGNVDVYLVPVEGGSPRRLTWHPAADTVQGWTPDGRILFASGRYNATDRDDTNRTHQLFTLATDGAWPELIPLPMAHAGAFSPDGKRLVYEPMRRAFEAWKRYRGGTASYLWVADLKDSSVVKVPRTDSNDFNPMWIGSKIYFLSDREGPVTLWTYDPQTQQVQKLLQNTGLDLKSASAGPGAIVYEQFGSLHLFDLASSTSRRVEVSLQGDMPGVRPRYTPITDRIAGSALSPTGARVIFESRGELVSVPAEKGTPRNLTNTPGVMERSPAWSPDGKTIAYFSDASGEYALHLKPQDGKGEVRVIPLPPGFYYRLSWSPDSQKLAFSDRALNLWLLPLDKEGARPDKIDTLERGGGDLDVSWAPDSRWMAYTRPLPSQYSAAFVYSLADRKRHQITDGMSDVGDPTFDASGKYLYFTASTDIGPGVSGFDMNSYPHRSTRSVYLAVLKKGEPSPLAPESDEEKAPEKKDTGTDKAAPNGTDQKDGKPESKDKKAGPTVIDFDGLDQRILALPVPARDLAGIAAGKEGEVYLLEATEARSRGPVDLTLHKFELSKRKLDKVMDGLRGFFLTHNGEKMLVRKADGWYISPAGTAPKPGEGKVPVERAEIRIEPRAEWQQMYREAWRIERDFFYDPGHHGLDLKAAEKRYAPYLEGLHHRADLNYLFSEMLGELSVGHLYVGGGDMPSAKRVPGGLLGADFRIDQGRYRFARIYTGENWNPNLQAPLTQPGAEVKAGEYLLAVNGQDLTVQDTPYRLLENTSGRQVLLKVGPSPDGKGSREVTVVPVANETGLRNLAWIEGNRRKVGELSGDRLAYVWLPDTADGGYTHFNRYWFAQLDKQGAVLDERWNRGGSAADYIIDYLKKPVNSYWAVRYGADFRQPFGTMPGPKAMLVNESSGSGGDYMPWLFKRAGLGPLIGKRTWGGLVGIGGYPQLMDGGGITAPHFAFYTPEGTFGIENEGVAPDLEVDLDPKAWREGRDTQLERGVKAVLEALAKHPPAQVRRPPYPNYHKR